MFSINGDVILDPFVGTGTTMAASLASGRNAIGIEMDESFIPSICSLIESMPSVANTYNRERLIRHIQFVEKRTKETGPLKHSNVHYGLPVMTAQEREHIIPELESISKNEKARFVVSYLDKPQSDFLNVSTINDYTNSVEIPLGVANKKRKNIILKSNWNPLRRSCSCRFKNRS